MWKNIGIATRREHCWRIQDDIPCAFWSATYKRIVVLRFHLRGTKYFLSRHSSLNEKLVVLFNFVLLSVELMSSSVDAQTVMAFRLNIFTLHWSHIITQYFHALIFYVYMVNSDIRHSSFYEFCGFCESFYRSQSRTLLVLCENRKRFGLGLCLISIRSIAHAQLSMHLMPIVFMASK